MNIEIIFNVGDMGHHFFVFVDAHDLQMLEQSTHGIALYESFINSVFSFNNVILL